MICVVFTGNTSLGRPQQIALARELKEQARFEQSDFVIGSTFSPLSQLEGFVSKQCPDVLVISTRELEDLIDTIGEFILKTREEHFLRVFIEHTRKIGGRRTFIGISYLHVSGDAPLQIIFHPY